MDTPAMQQQNRILVVDALRGLALLGILIANVPFSAPEEGPLRTAVSLLIDKKFITIFSMLFGFGFYIQWRQATKQQAAFEPYYFFRMLILLLIGCIHAYFFWFGDIIRDYAICGVLLLLVYKWPAKRMLVTAVTFIVLLTGTVYILNAALQLQQYPYDRAIVTELPATTSYWRYLQINATIDPFVNFIQDSPLTLVFCFGNMLLGMWLARIGFFHRPEKFRQARNIIIVIGLTGGLFCSYLFWQLTTGQLEMSTSLIWLPYAIVAGMVLQSLMYVSVFLHLFQLPFWKKALSLFAPVGKMALTNYLLQTLFYIVFFFHWLPGTQLYGILGLGETYLFALMLFAGQVAFSHWWLRRYSQGPVEKLWKKLSYRFYKRTETTNIELT